MSLVGEVELVVGRVGRPHGVAGLLTVEVRTDDPQGRFAPGTRLLTDPPERGPLVVEDVHEHSGRLLLAFEGVRDRTAAEALRDTLLVVRVDPAERPEDPEEFFDHQLVGLGVRLADGSEVGTVREVLHLPAQDVLAVARPKGQEVLVPFVVAIVPVVDLDAGHVVLEPPPGLLDDASAEVAGTRDGGGPL